MARYRIEDSIVDTDKASWSFRCDLRPGGYGYVRKTVYRSRRGRWYVETWHSWAEDNRQLDRAEWISPQEAARLILESGGELPPDLAAISDEVSE